MCTLDEDEQQAEVEAAAAALTSDLVVRMDCAAEAARTAQGMQLAADEAAAAESLRCRHLALHMAAQLHAQVKAEGASEAAMAAQRATLGVGVAANKVSSA
jgi:hypothetical protein